MSVISKIDLDGASPLGDLASIDDVIISASVAEVLEDLSPRLAKALEEVSPAALVAFAETRSPRHVEKARRKLRDAAIVALAKSGWSAAQIATEMDFYERTSWIRDRRESACPDRYLRTRRQLLWLAMKMVPHSLTRQRIVQIIENIE